MLKKFTTAAKVAATDKSKEVVANLSKNCQRNGIDNGMIVAPMEWSEHSSYKTKFDFVVGADIVYQGCPVQVLISAIDKLLNAGGKAILVVPSTKSESDIVNSFVSLLDPEVFSVSKEKLVDEYYMESPLLNQVEGFEQFPTISSGYFYVYILTKLGQKAAEPGEKSSQSEGGITK